MKDKRALHRLQKEFANHDGLYLWEMNFASAHKNQYLKSRKGRALQQRIGNAFGKADTNLPIDLTKILTLENNRHAYSEKDFSALGDAITLSLLHYIVEEKDTTKRKEHFAFSEKVFRALSLLDLKKLYEELSVLHQALLQHNPHQYRKLDDHSRLAVRQEVLRFAKQRGLSERDAVGQYTKEKPTPNTTLRCRIALCFFFFLGILLFAAAWILCGIWQGILLLLPCFALSLYITQSLLLRIFPPIPVYSLKAGPIPESASVLVVITALLSGKEGDNELFSRLRKYYFRNKGKNIRFGILADLPESSSAEDSNDAKILQNAKDQWKKLQTECGDHFCLFIRSRQKSFSEGSYMGWERKRGAILELCRAARGKNHSFLYMSDSQGDLTRFRYIITLDADTELSMGSVCELVHTMLHPENRPKIKNGIVVSGYGVLQPRMTASLPSAGKSLFSVLQTGSGGKDSYEGAAGDFDQNTFGKSGFCGKGIFDIDAFLQTLDNAYPDERILSHDLLESTRLRCGALTAKTFIDSVPQGPLSFYKRQHRWMRGDLQSLPFSFRYHVNASGKRIQNNIDLPARLMIWRNILVLLRPVFCFAAIVSALFLPPFQAYFTFLFAILHLLIPFIKTLLFSVRNAGRRFYSAVVQGIWQAFLDMLYNLAGLAETACLHLDAVLRSTFRMTVSKKHLLQWVTADHMERGTKNSLAAYMTGMWKSIVIGILFIVFAPGGLLTLFGVLTFLFPFVGYLISRPFKERKQISQADKQQLISYAKDTFGYYTAFVTEATHHLPPDNYQFSPVAVLAERTSPTNIAMYLLSCLAAVDLDFITPDELYTRLSKTLFTLKDLPKYKGHLYNWYSTKTLDVIGMPYISTVDSGNFITALSTLQQGLWEYVHIEPRLYELLPEIKNLIANCDFTFLYNKNRHLFCIGYDPVNETASENCYDLYMSESRTTSYYLIAKGIVEKEHWQYLGRPLIKSEGHMGMASWSGTCFEYFMPRLLLPAPSNSLSYECLGYALFEQVHDDHNGLWGRSESGYYAFDNDMNYQYKAFGAHTLALDPHSLQNDVLAPYACFLTLPMSIDLPLKNLKRMQSEDMYGPYGFYEAIDYTPSRVGRGHGVVRSYMAHHVGMTILACANAVKDDLFVKRFMRENETDAADELLMERIPVNTPIARKLRRRPTPPSHGKRVLMPEDFTKQQDTALPRTASLFAHNMTLLASADGGLSLMAENTALTYPYFDSKMSQRGIRLLVKTDHGILDAFNCPGGKFGRYEDALVYAAKRDGISYQTAFTASGDLPLISMQLSMEGDFQSAEPMLLSEVILSRTADWEGHPNYTGLFVQCQYLAQDHALVFKRRPKKENEKPFYFLITLEGGGFDFIARRDASLPSMYGEEDIHGLFERSFDNKDGQCIMPFFALRRPSECPSGKFAVEFLFLAGEDIDFLLKSIRTLRQQRKTTLGALISKSYTERTKSRLLASGYDLSLIRYEQFILSSLLYNTKKEPDRLVSTCSDLFWRHGISADLPMIALLFPKDPICDNVKRILSGFLRTQKYLSFGNIRFDLLLFYEETEQYACPSRSFLISLVTETVGEGVFGRKGGVHLLTDKDTQNAAEYLCPIFLKLDRDTVFEKAVSSHFKTHPRKNELTIIQKPSIPTKEAKHSLLSLASGSFTEKGYRVNKQRCFLPQSRIYCSHQFGTLLTHNSLGVTYFRNASEFSLTRRTPDPLLDLDAEKLLMKVNDRTFDLCAAAHTVDFTLACAVYTGNANDIQYELKVGCDAKFPVKILVLTLSNTGQNSISPLFSYQIKPDLGKSRCIRKKAEEDTVFYRSLDTLFAREEFGIYQSSLHLPSEIKPGETKVCHFLLGVINYRNDRSYYVPREKLSTPENALLALENYKEGYQKLLSKWKLATVSPALDLMFNEYIPYQTLTSRIFARTGFYQSGGAYGFRDQLQDCVNMLPIDPDLAARQILRCATRQYAEGDVQHWWHESIDGPHGMRTRCSDDLLWLPYAVSEYVSHTGNHQILDRKLPYLSSPPLRQEEEERYEKPSITAHRESLKLHCFRAMDLVLQRKGAHGLPLFGSGDWNDGMNAVGKEGKGESVWLGMFLVLVLERFCTVCSLSEQDRKRYTAQAKQMRKILLDCFENDRFLRGYFDDGSPLGSENNAECKIDILPQAFSAFLFPHDRRSHIALATANRHLYDKEARILKLFTPAFDVSTPNPGYIRGYLPGIRENGGQYTHGAMWGALGFFAIGMADEGYTVLCGSNPAARCLIPSLSAKYRLEPYALAGDIYAGPHAGRGGWSQYTGAAGWFYTAVLKGMLGYRCIAGKITLCPRLPSALPSVTLKIEQDGKMISRTLQRENSSDQPIEVSFSSSSTL